ncbi:MAG: hypothetical protein WBB01_03950 [Phormidesmis sp.]
MLKLPFLSAVSVFVTLISWAGFAKASEDPLGLNFALPPTSPQVSRPLSKIVAPSQIAAVQDLVRYVEPLPPLTDGLARNTAQKEQVSEEVFIPPSSGSLKKADDDVGLSFAKSEEDLLVKAETSADRSSTAEEPSATEAEVAENAQGLEDWIFEGGSNSLVARAVGSAEGTRHWSGSRTPAYYGHRDPGNGVWNRGTFSYQHEARSPEDADVRQLQRLKRQSLQLEEQAQKQGLKLDLEEKLNGVDLANQAPLAALDRGGYIEQLAKAHRLSMEGIEAIVYARTHAYLDPDTKQWNAPGLGNTVQSIDRDQRRRAAAIAQAQQAYLQGGNNDSALSNFEDIHLVDPASERSHLLASNISNVHGFGDPLPKNSASANPQRSLSKLSFELPPTATGLLAPLDDQPTPTSIGPATPNKLADIPVDNPAPGIHFSAIDEAEIMAAVEAVPAGQTLPTVAETFSADRAEPAPESPNVASEAIDPPAPENDAITKLPPAPPVAPVAPIATTTRRDDIPQIVPVPPVAPPIAPAMKDTPKDAPIHQRLWRYEDKIGDDAIDETGLTAPAEK